MLPQTNRGRETPMKGQRIAAFGIAIVAVCFPAVLGALWAAQAEVRPEWYRPESPPPLTYVEWSWLSVTFVAGATDEQLRALRPAYCTAWKAQEEAFTRLLEARDGEEEPP